MDTNTNESKRVFAVGDRVRVTTDDVNKGEDIGKLGFVVGHRYDNIRPIRVLLDEDYGESGGGYYATHEIVVIDAPPLPAQYHAPVPAPVTAAKTRQDALTELWQSTAALYQRFDLQPTQEATRRVLREECGKLCDMSARLEHMDEPGAERMRVCGDLSRKIADVIVTAIGVGIAHDIDDMRLLNAIASVIVKNDAKTHATHEVNSAGEIARKAVQS